MSSVVRYSETCKVTQAASKKSIDAVIQDFQENDKLNVIINKSIKLGMKWNGRTYEGRAAGMDFTSDGPTITRTQTSVRG
jgi:hypothetical protein